MKTEIIKNAEEIRQRYIECFVDSKEKFKEAHNREFVARLEDFDKWYDGAFIWDKITNKAKVTSIGQSLEQLRSKAGNVLFMSEGKDFKGSCHMIFNSEEIQGFVARANAKELAEKISYEWYESVKQYLESQTIMEKTLPEDLYVFDESFEWTIVFTHETDGNVQSPIDDLDSRLCFVYGFDI